MYAFKGATLCPASSIASLHSAALMWRMVQDSNIKVLLRPFNFVFQAICGLFLAIVAVSNLSEAQRPSSSYGPPSGGGGGRPSLSYGPPGSGGGKGPSTSFSPPPKGGAPPAGGYGGGGGGGGGAPGGGGGGGGGDEGGKVRTIIFFS